MVRLQFFLKAEMDVGSVDELDLELERFLDAPVGQRIVQDVSGIRAACITAIKDAEGEE